MTRANDSCAMREYLGLAFLAIVLATPRLWAAAATPFSLGDQGGIVVSVTLNGAGPFKMLLDTGATHSAITTDIADLIGARVVAQTNVISPVGSAVRPIVAVQTLAIGPISVDVILPSVAPERSFDPKGEIKGLIGQDVLAGLRYTLDFKRRVIEWHDAAPRQGGTMLHLSFEHGRYLVALRQPGTTLRFVPDSGAGGLVLFEGRSGPRFPSIATGETVELSTATGSQAAAVVRLPELRIGDRILRNVRAVTIRGDEMHPAAGDGLLPLHLFGRVTFDGPARTLILDMMFF
jgi:predicted aspartyl protease